MNSMQMIISIAIMSLVTIFTRFLPFFLFNGKSTPKWIDYLGKSLPYAVMAMLVVYCLKGVSFSSVGTFVPEMIAVLIVILSYIWKKNSLASIVLGTVSYMILVQLVF